MTTRRQRPRNARCVGTDVGAGHPLYGKSWCGRDGLYRYQVVTLAHALETPERGGELEHDLDVVDGERVDRCAGVRRMTSGPTREWHYVNAGHALVSAYDEDCTALCPDCARAICDMLEKRAGIEKET